MLPFMLLSQHLVMLYPNPNDLHFGISYRKKRRVPFSLKDFEILAFGDELKYKSLVLRKTKFNGDEYSRERSLFDL